MTEEFEPGVAPPEFDVFALRTFKYCTEYQQESVGETIGWWNDGLSRAFRSPVRAVGDDWEDGTCVARCSRRHDAPHDNCGCGIYGSLSYYGLLSQYPQARHLVTVIAAEGQTIMGTRGLRTQFARVVAYWADLVNPYESSDYTFRPQPFGIQPTFKELAQRQFKGAESFDCPIEMTERYGLSLLPPPGASGSKWA